MSVANRKVAGSMSVPCGAIAQLGARLVRNEKVVSSNLTSSTKLLRV